MRLLFTISAIFIQTFIFAQMAGVYYMGYEDSDFQTVDQLFNAFQNGTSDTVRIVVRAGEYTCNDCTTSWFDSDFPIIIESEDLNRDSVTWNANNVKITLSGPANLHFRHLSFDANDSQAGALRAWNAEKLQFDTCRFIAHPDNFNSDALDISSSNEETILIGCESIGGDVSIHSGGPGIFKHNKIYSDIDFNGGWDTITQNTFYNNSRLPSSSEVFENRFDDGVSCSFCEDLYFHDNHVFGEFNPSFPDDLRIVSNVFHETVDFGYGTDILIAHNYFYKNMRTGIMETPSLMVVFNNFAEGADYIFWGYNIQRIANNNFFRLLPISFDPDFNDVILKNNFWPSPGYYGSSLYNIDPMYLSADSLRTTNPLLTGLGTPLWFWLDPSDIEGNQRSNQPTVGAHELCIDVDTVSIECGQKVISHLCGFTTDAEILVSPSTGVEYNEQPFPFLRPLENTMYYIQDTITNQTDSIYILVEPFAIEAIDNIGIWCGSSVELYVSPYDTSEVDISWSPPNEVQLFSNYYWYAQPEEYTQYHITVDHPLCGSATDSINVFVNNEPDAGATASFDQETLTVQFTNLSSCYTFVLWDFGDGFGSSTQENPIYQYTAPGGYFYTIYAFNGTQVDSSLHNIFVDFPTNIDDLYPDPSLIVYPNPSRGSFSIEFENFRANDFSLALIDLQGRLVFSEDKIPAQIGDIEHRLKLKDLQPGFYILKLSIGNNVLERKIQIVR